jgi:hypothetical protein
MAFAALLPLAVSPAALSRRTARQSSAARPPSRTTGATEPANLARWLLDPAQQRPNAHMPALELTEADVQALAAYLGSLR